jgi:hypothetical protein
VQLCVTRIIIIIFIVHRRKTNMDTRRKKHYIPVPVVLTVICVASLNLLPERIVSEFLSLGFIATTANKYRIPAIQFPMIFRDVS